MASREDRFKLVIAMTQKVTKKHGGLTIGTTIKHSNFDQTYILKKIENGLAIVYVPAKHSATGRDVIRKFPLHEIYDAKLAQKLANASMNGTEPE